MKLTEKNEKSFCVLPWLHAHVNSSGERALCCMSLAAPPEYSSLSWDEFKNSDYMKNIRQQMLNGKLPKECFLCAKSNAPVVLKDEYNKRYEEEISTILENTAEDGSTQQKLRYIDYRSNICNLSCRMCCPQSSNSFQKIINAADDELVESVFGYQAKKDHLVITRKFRDSFVPDFIHMLETENITDIYFAGGEPLVEPNHIKFLEAAKKTENQKNISISYNSNLAFSQKILEKWIPQTADFKFVSVLASIDGVGEIYEYIRHGASFSKFDSNLDYLMQNANSNFAPRLDITLNSLNIFFLEDFARYCLSKKINAYSRLMVGGDHLNILKPEAVPKDIRILIQDRWSIFFNSLSSNEKQLLEMLNAGVDLFVNTNYLPEQAVPAYLEQLKSFEVIFTQSKNNFIDLLCKDELGKSWAANF